jgi:TfoX/Sxy family transcriptional regulator of competence genes
MAYDEEFAERIRKVLKKKKGIREQKMFGGLCFMLHDKMSVGVLKDVLVLRVSPETGAELLKKPGVRPMDFTGRPMKGFLYVSQSAFKTAKALKTWIGYSLDYVSTIRKRK